MSSKFVNIYLNGQHITTQELSLNEKLINIRSLLLDKIDDSYLFTLGSGDKIGLSNESYITLEDIIIDGEKMFLTSEKIIKKNIPIEGSKLIGNIGKLKIYEYPTIKLTEIEESSSISLLVVGETGSGKTTLLNAFINVLMDIQITDDFRYKIIIEKFVHSNDVNIYNIKPIGNRPAIKIIDTPGFGDSRGIKQDKIIRDKIADAFKIN